MVTSNLVTLLVLYTRHGVPVDQLRYTQEFVHLYCEVTGAPLTRAKFWRVLANARNAGCCHASSDNSPLPHYTLWG